MEHSIEVGSKKISYQLNYSKRKTLGITVTPDSDVIVKAPIDTSIEKIEEKLRKKLLWIIKQQSFFLSFPSNIPEKRYISGESIYYLGRQYKLEVALSSKNEVYYKGRYISAHLKKKSNAKELLNLWYKERAKIKFEEIASPIIERFKKLGVTPSGIFIQEMKSRWGSCTPQGKIILNTELIKVPKVCIEYVIIHELCHLIHHNHTKSFFELQEVMCPDWEKRKEKLEEYGLLI